MRALVLLLGLGATSLAHAAEDAPRPSVGIVIPGADGTGQALISALTVELSDLPVTLVIERVPELPQSLSQQIALVDALRKKLGALSVFWFDTSVPERIFVYVAEPGGGRLQVRSVQAAGEIERAEAVATVIRGLVRALVARGRVGIEAMQEQPEVLQPPPRVSLTFGYAAGLFASQAPLTQGAAASLEVGLSRAWVIGAGYQLLVPTTSTRGGVSLTVARHPVDLGLRWQLPLGDWRVGAGVFGTLDVLTRQLGASTVPLSPGADRATLVGSVAVLLRADWSPREAVRFFVSAGPEAVLNTLDFAADLDGARVILLSTWPLRARLSAGVSVDLW